MAFKLGDEKRKISNSKNVSFASKSGLIRHGNPGEGALAQANMDGSIDIDPSIPMNSALGKRIIKHEQKHLEQMDDGRAAYGDNWVMWEDKIYFRGEEDGVKYIDGPNGRWPEGHPYHPWEAEAIEAEKQ
jgi:hypothetical protein